MPAQEIEVTIGSVELNQNLDTGSFYVLKNTPELLSTLSTRKTDAGKQGDHGMIGSLSFYEARILPFEGELWAASQSARVTMEQALKEEIALSVAQDYASDDGYVLVLITDEDGIGKQLYAKVLEPPKITMIENAMPESRSFEFMLYAKDPTIYAQSLSSESGPESYPSTTFLIQDGALEELKDGALPTLQDTTGAEMSVSNSGNFGTAPVITISGPTTNPVVTNSTTGKVMDFSKGAGVSLLSGETLTIDVLGKTITKTAAGGSETDESGALSDDSEWIYILPGANVFTLFDDTPDDLTMQMTVQFRSAWI